MTLDEWFDKYFAPEYLNVQDPQSYKDSAKAELQSVKAAAPKAPPSGNIS